MDAGSIASDSFLARVAAEAKTRGAEVVVPASHIRTVPATRMIQPLQDRLVVMPLEQPDKTTGGLFIPEGAREKPTQGEVLAVGPGNEKPLLLNVGDRVLFGRFAGTEIEWEGAAVIILRQSDVLARLP